MADTKRENTSVAIGLVNPKSPINVGSVMRASGCFGAHAIYYTGNRFEYAAKYRSDTNNIANAVPLIKTDDFKSVLAPGQKLVCVELVEGATPLPQFQHPEKALYVFGPEDGSVPQAIVDQADAVVFVPTTGCLNLAATVNVLLYDRTAKQLKQQQLENPNELIQQSRDNNNRLKVKD